jgi:hypothetical protein
MPIFKEITAAKKRLYLETLANTGRYAEAVNAAGVDPSLPHYWRHTDPQFVAAEMAAKQQAAEKIVSDDVKIPLCDG